MGRLLLLPLSFLLAASVAQASVSFRPVSAVQPKGTWLCTANGSDSAGKPRSITGGFRGSKDSAKSNAIHACLGSLSNCAISSCQREP